MGLTSWPDARNQHEGPVAQPGRYKHAGAQVVSVLGSSAHVIWCGVFDQSRLIAIAIGTDHH